jgi:hypothetical protein
VGDWQPSPSAGEKFTCTTLSTGTPFIKALNKLALNLILSQVRNNKKKNKCTTEN